jgi:hypothetical protein
MVWWGAVKFHHLRAKVAHTVVGGFTSRACVPLFPFRLHKATGAVASGLEIERSPSGALSVPADLFGTSSTGTYACNGDGFNARSLHGGIIVCDCPRKASPF